jgi:hypothetical protein
MIFFNKKYQTMPDMPPAQFNALKQDIQERGLITPIDIDENGQILDGHHRYQALLELGITDFPTIVRPGLSEAEKRLYSRKTNMMRRHLGAKQIRQLIRDQLKETPEWSNNRIGMELGCDGKTVKTQRLKLESTSEIPKLTKFEGADGKVRKKRSGGIFATTGMERDNLLAHLEKHGVCGVESFLSAETAFRIVDSNYNVWAGLSKEQENEWHVFTYFLWKHCRHKVDGAAMHVEWLRSRSFKTPDEWLGPVGVKWMRSCGMNRSTDKQCAKMQNAFADFLEKNRDRVELLINEMEKGAQKEW